MGVGNRPTWSMSRFVNEPPRGKLAVVNWPRSERRKRLKHSLPTDELFDLVELARQEVGEVLVAVLGDHDDVLVAEVDLLLGHAELRVDREDVAGLERPPA